MRKLISLFLAVVLLLSLAACGNRQAQPAEAQPDETQKPDEANLFQQFLDGDIPAYDKSGVEKLLYGYLIFDVNQNPYTYAFFDVANDGITELCVWQYPEQYFFQEKDGQVHHWYTETKSYSHLLNNGAFLYERHGAAPTNIRYEYYELDANAQVRFSVEFSWWDGASVEQGKVYPDTYFLDGKEVTKAEYDAKTEKYLSIGKDQILWYNMDGTPHKTETQPTETEPQPSANTPDTTPEDSAPSLQAVLENKQTFLDYENSAKYISSYGRDVWQYTVVDMDGDKTDELAVMFTDGSILILRMDGDSARGYYFGLHAMYRINTDGTYFWNADAGETYGCDRLEFNGNDYKTVQLYRVEKNASGVVVYYINGESVSELAYKELSATQGNKTSVSWISWPPEENESQNPAYTRPKTLAETIEEQIEAAWKADSYLPEYTSTAGQCDLWAKYTQKWKEVADEYYEKIMQYDDVVQPSEYYYSAEDLHTFVSNMKTNWESYSKQQCEHYFGVLQTYYQGGTIVGPLAASYRYEQQKYWALEILKICQMFQIT